MPFSLALEQGCRVFLGIPGEEFIGIYSSNELLTRINLMKAYKN